MEKSIKIEEKKWNKTDVYTFRLISLITIFFFLSYIYCCCFCFTHKICASFKIESNKMLFIEEIIMMNYLMAKNVYRCDVIPIIVQLVWVLLQIRFSR